MSSPATGTVYLVGAGPGDPGLLTLRGAELLARADVIVCDAGVNLTLLERYTSSSAVVMVTGQSGVAFPSGERFRSLVELAERHATVVRLMAGDTILSEAAEEAMSVLAEAGVPYQVVPGVAIELAVPACAGIPLRMREQTAGVLVLLTDTPDQPAAMSQIRPADVKPSCTVIATSRREHFDSLTLRLSQTEHSLETPAAVIWSGTLPRQQTVVGTLGSVADLGKSRDEDAVVVVGDVVRQRKRLAWFERRPLFGRRIAVTRPRAQAGGLVAELEELGAEVIQFPTIRIQPVADREPLRQAAREVDRFDWIVFTSVNGVSQFWKALREVGRDTRSLAGVSVCAIGPATADALEAKGVRADLMPARFVAEAVLETLSAEVELAGRRILLPRAELARSVLPEELRARGAEVDEVVAYQTLPDAVEAEAFGDRLQGGSVDLITFTSSSTVQNFVELLGRQIGQARVASIGPITSATARQLGLPVHVEAEEYTVPGLIRAIVEHYQKVEYEGT